MVAKKNKKKKSKSIRKENVSKQPVKIEVPAPIPVHNEETSRTKASRKQTNGMPFKKILIAVGSVIIIGAPAYLISSLGKTSDVSLTSQTQKQVVSNESAFKITAFPSKKTYSADENISFELQTTAKNSDKTTITWENYSGPKKANVQGSFTSFERGKHKVKATVCDGDDCEEVVYTFTVKNSAPTKPDIQMSPGKGLTSDTNVLFSHTFVSDPDGDDLIVEWKLDDGSWISSPPNGYFKAGKHSIRIRAVDSEGAASKVSKKTIQVAMGKNNTYAKVADEQEKRQKQEAKITAAFKQENQKTDKVTKKTSKGKNEDEFDYQCTKKSSKTLSHPVSVSGVEYTDCSKYGLSVGEIIGVLAQEKLQFQGADFYDEFKLDIENQHAFKTNDLQDRLYIYTLKNAKEVDKALKDVKKQTKKFDRYTVFPYKVKNSLVLYLQNDKKESVKDTIENTLDTLRQKPEQK